MSGSAPLHEIEAMASAVGTLFGCFGVALLRSYGELPSAKQLLVK